MTPIKALCSERFEDWKRKFEALVNAVPRCQLAAYRSIAQGIRCALITGDSYAAEDISREHADMHKSDIIITTPVSTAHDCTRQTAL